MIARIDTSLERIITRIEGFLPVDAVASPRRELVERQDLIQRIETFDQLKIGQIVNANVAARLDDGSYMVDIGGAQARMLLPAQTAVGQKLALSLQSRTPQLSFQIEGEMPVSSGTEASITSLSPGARLIDSVLLKQSEQEGTPIIQARTPILATPRMPTPQIEQALRQAIESSGLFYEAHVAQWAHGARTIEALNKEPQQQLFQLQNMMAGKGISNDFSQRSALSSATPNAANESAQQSVPHPQNANAAAQALLQTAIQAAQASHLAQAQTFGSSSQAALNAQSIADLPVAVVAPGADSLAPLQPQIAQLVSAQIDTHEHQRFEWHGEAWPGQMMEWETARQGHQDHSDANSSNTGQDGSTSMKVWQTTVRLDMPNLGRVSARIDLIGERLHFSIEGQDNQAVERMRMQTGTLTQRLQAAGLNLAGLSVDQER